MTTFLWLISFVLHGVSLFLIILLSLKWAKIKETEREQAELIREMETMMTTYLMQFKEENERFVKQMTSSAVRQKKKKPLPYFETNKCDFQLTTLLTEWNYQQLRRRKSRRSSRSFQKR